MPNHYSLSCVNSTYRDQTENEAKPQREAQSQREAMTFRGEGQLFDLGTI